ncbi:Uu.00g068970.m01.CDS01 [Anthostomella pinea]|uniref:Uu.00g068970.m01.CDS01 n=1 Tax=Anthostomella pinea TaxID=933095 RepID=A0AAI8VUE2_9PEZI|nr:Uu.00g068970.m01.CDS01 [Anthostomella pinea]
MPSIMDPSANSPASGKSQRIEYIISFSRDLRKISPIEIDEAGLRDSINEIHNQIRAIRSYTLRSPGPQRYAQLDSAGLELWNWCTQLKRQYASDASPTAIRFLVLVRVFSFQIFALAQWGDNNTAGDLVRLQRLALKTGRFCIANSELEFADLALQKAAEYNGLLQKLQAKLPAEELSACKRSEIECLTLRIALAWKDGKLAVADHLYENLEKSQKMLDPTSAETLIGSLLEIGKDLSVKKNFVLAVKWLERAYGLINRQELGQLSRDAVEMRLAISQALIQAYLNTDTADGFQKAENHVGYIQNEMGDSLVVLLLRLEILLHSPGEVFDSDSYASVLRRMIRTVDISESSFKLVVHHIRKLDDKSPGLACSVLDEFITSRILPAQRDEWVDKVVILRSHMAVTHRDTSEGIQALTAMFDQVETTTEKPLPAATALGVQILVWKKVDANFNQGQVDIAELWCRLLLHPVLQQSGPLNTAKISRKLLLCALQRNNLNGAAEVLHSMSDAARRDPMTMYLAYKLALINGDREMVLDSLHHISEASSKDQRYLYACCTEAQRANDKLCLLKALQHLYKRHDYTSMAVTHVPALLRMIIRLDVTLLADKEQHEIDRHTLVDDICEVFESVVTALKKSPRDGNDNKLFTVDELDWFSKNAYNLGLSNLTTWEAQHVVRIQKCCLAIIAQYPPDIPAQASKDISLRGMFCNFLAATTLIALARSEDNVELQLQRYLNMRNHIKDFDAALEAGLRGLDEDIARDLQAKLSTLLVFDFEGAVCLKS